MSLRNYIESSGSIYRDLKYSEVSQQGGPLVEKQIAKTDGKTGGQSEFQTRVVTPVTARLDDVARITKLLGKAGGVRWEAHQAELQAIQNNLENKRKSAKPSEDGILMSTLKNVGKALLTDIGLTASTLAQVAVAGTGEHQTPYISRAYLKTGGESGTLGTIGAAVGITSGNNINGGASALSGEEIIGRPEYSLISPEFSGYHRDSHGGARRESSKYAPKESDWKAVDFKQNRLYFNEGNLQNSSSYKYETEKEEVSNGINIPEITDDFGNVISEGRTIVYGGAQRGSLLSKDVENVDNIGFEGSRVTNNAGTWDGVGNEIEKQAYNKDYPYITHVKHKTKLYLEGISGGFNEKTGRGISKYVEPHIEQSLEYKSDFEGEVENLIPFVITTISPERRTYLAFQANLESYSDDYNGSWDGVQYIGRAEKFYAYTGFDRSISFSFKVLAKNRQYLIPMYKNLNALAASTAPTYGSDGLFMRGTLTSVTIGDLLQNQKGFFTKVGLKWETDYLWEVEKGEGEYMRVPHILDVSVSFTPIHSFNVTAENWNGDDKGSYFGFSNNVTTENVERNGLISENKD